MIIAYFILIMYIQQVNIVVFVVTVIMISYYCCYFMLVIHFFVMVQSFMEGERLKYLFYPPPHLKFQ